jgi:hypothetical protein
MKWSVEKNFLKKSFENLAKTLHLLNNLKRQLHLV